MSYSNGGAQERCFTPQLRSAATSLSVQSVNAGFLAAVVAILHDVAMTGEITLRGRVLPVGGVRDKVLAAHHANIKHVILPARNECNLEELPVEVREGPGALRMPLSGLECDIARR